MACLPAVAYGSWVNRFVLGLSAASVLLTGCFDPDDQTDLASSSTSDGSTSDAPPGSSTAASQTTGVSASAGPSTSTGETSAGGCTDDADCDNGLACDGIETCDGDTCVAGSDPCEAPAEGCATVCEESDSGAVCSAVAEDADGDGQGSAACKAAPGDDCDDSLDTVFLGAEEICDGVDNDCNGLADLDDGLPIFGTATITPLVIFADLAYSPTDQAYGIAYSTLSGEDMFLSYNLDQSPRAAPTPFPDDVADRVFLEWTGETFAGVYRRDGQSMARQAITADGFTSATAGISASGGVGSGYAASEFSDGGLAVGWERGANEFAVRFLAADLAPAGQEIQFVTTEIRRQPRFSRVEDTIAIAWRDSAAQLGFYDQDLAEQSVVELTTTGSGSVYGTLSVGAMGDGFAVSYRSGTASQRVEYAEYERDGSLRCGPIDLTEPGPVNYFDMDTFEGTAAIYVANDADWTLRRIRENCEVVDEGAVIENVPFFGETGDIDINESGIGIVSQIFDEGGGDSARMSFRAFGPNVCDAPVSN